MSEENKLQPFSTLNLDKFFEYDLEKINMAFRLSGTIHSNLKNIRASGDQVEFAIKQFYKSKLFPKYHVCDGHIIDKNLKVSPQYDIIISENAKNPILFDLADKSQLVYFESVYLFGEVKRSFYKDDLLHKFIENISRFKSEMERESISPDSFESGGAVIHLQNDLTKLPLRNPLFSFMFFVNSSSLEISKISKTLKETENKNLPNIIVLLDQGLIVNVNSKLFEQDKIIFNLYPEFSEDSKWIFIEMSDGGNSVLTYHYMLIQEHLNNCILGQPHVLNYTKNLFDFSPSNFHEL